MRAINYSLRSVISGRSYSIRSAVKLPATRLSRGFLGETMNCARFLSTSIDRFEHKDLVMLQENSCTKYADRKLFGTKQSNAAVFDWITFGDFATEVQRFRNVLKHHEIGVNDKVAIISNNRVEWAVSYFAIMGVGAQVVPMYEAQLEKDWKYIVDDSDAKLLLVANEKIFEKCQNLLLGSCKNLRAVLSYEADDTYLHSYRRWVKLVEKETPFPPFKVDNPADHLATIIYTSGTTGNPKGVELTHTNIISNIASLEVSIDAFVRCFCVYDIIDYYTVNRFCGKRSSVTIIAPCASCPGLTSLVR
jgi:long-subunit acyl-CoA synthetase (AMP-forming)